MANDMMIAALNKQRAGKMDTPASVPESNTPEKPQGIEDRLTALEEKYEQICKLVGMDEKEAPQNAPRGY